MLIPMPAMPAQTGAPPPQVLAMRTPMLVILVLQTVMCTLRAALFLDIMGGFIIAICIGIGWYAWKEDMNVVYATYWGALCLVNGALETVKWLDHAVKAPLWPFSMYMPAVYNLEGMLSLMIPLSVLIGAPFAWQLYRRHKDSSTGYAGGVGVHAFGSSGGPKPPSKNAFGNSAAWRTFSGSGQQLGTA
mmetsp:Transcript_111154/g.313649  ORF Transcript_111154/g.313649 Transcript_111154/m.313649 type:complete len:189 (-) Transcript_111154:153-719(-)